MSDSYKRQLLYLLLAALLILAAGLGLRDPWPADEPRFALIAKEMAEGGSWLFPHVGGDLYPDKPPLFFWLATLFYLLTGSPGMAVLLPGLLAGIGVLLLVTDLSRRLWNEQVALCSGATLLVMLQFPLQMKSGQIDGLLCLWTTLSLYGFCRHLLLGPDWRWYALGGAAAGLGVITKGVGVLPFLLLLPYALARLRGWPLPQIPVRSSRWLLAPAALLLVVALWLVPMLWVAQQSADPQLAAYRDNILFHQTVTRYAHSFGHIKPFWYLFTNAIPWLWMPVSLLLPWLAPAWRRDLRKRSATVLLLGGWVLLVLLFFSLSDGKRSLYIFPAAPAIAMIAGLHVPELLERAGVRWLLFGLTVSLAALLVGLGAFLILNPALLQSRLDDLLAGIEASAMLIVIGVLVLMIAAWFRPRRAASGYLAAMLALWVGLGQFIAAPLNDTRSGAALIGQLEEHLGSGAELAFVDWPAQFVLQWNRPIVHFGYRRDNAAELRDAATWLSRSATRRLLLPEQLLGNCVDSRAAEFVGLAHRRNWYLAGPNALVGDCAAPKAGDVRVVLYSPPPP